MSTKQRLVTNFLSLAGVQGVSFLLPLLTLPYLTFVLGPSKFGLVSFAQAFIQYFMIFTDYGFIFVATRSVSLARDDKQKLSIIVSSVMAVRVGLMLISLLILLVTVGFVPKFRHDTVLYLVTFGIVVGNVMCPIWFFQGMERMKTVSILNVITKVVATAGTLCFVHNPSQFLYVPLWNTAGSLLVGVISLYLVIVRYGVSFVKPSKEDIVHQLKEGWHLFVSNIVTSLYTTSNVFILGFFASPAAVGYYASAERLMKAALAIITPLIQTLYPFLSRALEESREKAIWILQRAFWAVTLAMGTASLFVLVYAEDIVRILGPKYNGVGPILRIMAVLPLILGWANVWGILTMINFNYKQQLSRIYIVSSIVSVAVTVVCVPMFREYGTAWNAVVTEGLATMLMGWFLWKQNIPVWRLKTPR